LPGRRDEEDTIGAIEQTLRGPESGPHAGWRPNMVSTTAGDATLTIA